MNGPSAPPSLAPYPTDTGAVHGQPGADGVGERTGRHLRILAELAEIGMELARDVRRRALEEAETVSEEIDAAALDGSEGMRASKRADWALVFARIARAVRQTVALEARLAADADTRAQQGAKAEARLVAAERVRSKQQKDRVRRLVEGAIASEAEGHRAEDLRLDLDERLEDPDIEAELGWRPIGVIVAGICGDLGIEADLSVFSDAELGMDLSARPAGKPGIDARPASPDPDSEPGLKLVRVAGGQRPPDG